VGVALAAVSEDGNAAGLDDGQIGVVVVMDLGGHEISLVEKDAIGTG
jgi:hypothetical protein